MTHFSTCTGCSVDRATCPMLEVLKRGISGLYITTVKHRCERRVPLYDPGVPVLVKTFVQLDEYGDDDARPVFAWFPATFIRQVGTKGVAFVTPGTRSTCGLYGFETENRGFVKVTLTRMQPSDHAAKIDVAECKQCGAIRSIEECQGDLQWYACPQAAPIKPNAERNEDGKQE